MMLIVCNLLLLLSLTRCALVDDFCIQDKANEVEMKLARHFSSGGVGDVSSLIKETKAVAKQLRTQCDVERANRFDSYLDVLMYGNHTIDESINDTLNLVKKAQDPCHVCK